MPGMLMNFSLPSKNNSHYVSVISMRIISFLLLVAMSLKNLHRISCAVFPGSCGCRPTMMSPGWYSPPTAASRIAVVAAPRKAGTVATSTRLYSSNTDQAKEDSKTTPYKERVSDMWKKYGKLAIGTYLGIYVTTLSSIFFALDLDLFHAATFGFDPVAAITKFCNLYETVTGSDTLPAYIRENPRVGTFAIAWVMTKFTEPVRLATTLGIVPSVSRFIYGETNSKGERPIENRYDP